MVILLGDTHPYPLDPLMAALNQHDTTGVDSFTPAVISSDKQIKEIKEVS